MGKMSSEPTTQSPPGTGSLETLTMDGGYIQVLSSEPGRSAIKNFVAALGRDVGETEDTTASRCNDGQASETIAVGLAALNAFLQANVTGPVLEVEGAGRVEALFRESLSSTQTLADFRSLCFKVLEVDGVSPYPYIPHVELFALSRHIFLTCAFPETFAFASTRLSLPWTLLRVHATHYKLLTNPSLGPSSNFTKSSQWSDVPSLISLILSSLDQVEDEILAGEGWSKEDKVLCLTEMASYNIMLGRDDMAKEAIARAKDLSGFEYALSGALGKRTKFQEKSTSQLVVLAKSAANGDGTDKAPHPEALALNDDTLLENIDFQDSRNGNETKTSTIPESLKDLPPDNQPQLDPLDQIILLTEATLKDAFSPIDTLTSEEVLPYAVRVISDKSTNWQIYTQALIVRSRIEVHRSRTVERGVLQMQAVVDQVIVDATADSTTRDAESKSEADPGSVPSIAITAPDRELQPVEKLEKPRSFFPAAKPSESAPAHERLKYIHALSTPPKWHLESELAFAWAGLGSLVSALEIFKRLRLWPEVALCLASTALANDEQGRGSGGEEKAHGVIRWRLFNRTGSTSSIDADDEEIDDVTRIKPSDFEGSERTFTPNAPRLFCILGDLEDSPVHYQRAWEISKNRYSRAQKSLGEHYLQQKEWEAAREAYKKAVNVNRLSSELWSRLGDIHLRLGEFEDAAEAFGRAIGAADDVVGGQDARTWSNLGSALWSLYLETVEELKSAKANNDTEETAKTEVEADEDVPPKDTKPIRDPYTLIAQSLTAYKRGASIARSNWRIWDNVLTLASRTHPPSIPDMVHALQNIIRIRQSEEALDEDVLRALLQDAVLTKEKPATEGVYEPPRGSVERGVILLFQDYVQPLITTRSGLWSLMSQLYTWRRNYALAIATSEKAWRCATSTSSGGLLPSAGSTHDWTTDGDAWKEVVKRTDELVSVLENFGPQVESVGDRWRGKARSAVRSVMSKGKESWEGSDEWKVLEGLMEGLKR